MDVWWADGLGEPTSTHQVHQKTLLRCSVVLVAVPRLCCPLLRGFNGGHQKTQGDNAPSRQEEYPLPLKCTGPSQVQWATAGLDLGRGTRSPRRGGAARGTQHKVGGTQSLVDRWASPASHKGTSRALL